MQFFDAGSLSGHELSFYRTVHGPVFGYAHVHGRLVALSEKRASYGKDVLDLLFYHDLAHGLVHNVPVLSGLPTRPRRRSTPSTWTTRTWASSPAA